MVVTENENGGALQRKPRAVQAAAPPATANNSVSRRFMVLQKIQAAVSDETRTGGRNGPKSPLSRPAAFQSPSDHRLCRVRLALTGSSFPGLLEGCTEHGIRVPAALASKRCGGGSPPLLLPCGTGLGRLLSAELLVREVGNDRILIGLGLRIVGLRLCHALMMPGTSDVQPKIPLARTRPMAMRRTTVPTWRTRSLQWRYS